MRRSILACLVTVVLWSPVLCCADEPPARAETSIDRSEVLIGDPLQYVVTLTHPPGVTVEWPPAGGTLGDMTVEGSGAEPPHMANGMTIERRWYRLAGYSAGTRTIPEIVVTCRTKDGAAQEVRTQAVRITVRSLVPDGWERQEIRGAKPLVGVRAAWWWLLLGVAVVGGLGGAWWRRRQHQPVGVPSAPPRPAHEIALQALGALREEDLPSRNRYEEYYVRLSGIVRTYIEARFGLKAPEMTTQEFLQAASNAQALILSHRGLLEEFLERCDLVKFARYEPSRREADEAFEAGRRFFEDTASSAEPATASAGTSA